MANGKQSGEHNVETFRSWIAGKRDEDFRQYEYRGQLSRTEIAKECEFGKSALIQNPTIKKELEELEDRLRATGVLPVLEASQPGQTIIGSNSTRGEDERKKRLEAENAMLRAELEQKNKLLKRFGLMEKFMTETLRMPR